MLGTNIGKTQKRVPFSCSEFGASGGLMVTGQLSISFLQPVAVDTIVYVEVRLESRDGNRFNLEATVTTALVRKTPFLRATLCYFTKRGSGQT